MAVVIKNTTLITVDPEDAVHYDAAIAIEGGRVAALGPSADVLARYPKADVVDGRNKAVLPGFANIHTHFSLIIAKASTRTSRRRTSHHSSAGLRRSRSLSCRATR
jgi:5-methylthioadenosine/S-adenosylhomocysteine deaminase